VFDRTMFAGRSGSADQRLGDIAPRNVGEQWQHLVTQAIAHGDGLAIRDVLAPRKLLGNKPAAEVIAPQVEQGSLAFERAAGNLKHLVLLHPRQAAAAAQEIPEDGLRLVICMMREQ
jgi:hypothetical protein